MTIRLAAREKRVRLHASRKATRFRVVAALAMACAILSPAEAADYAVGTEAELRRAIIDANNDGDAGSTITLTNDIVITDPASMNVITAPLTVDTGTFTLSGEDAPAGTNPGASVSFVARSPGLLTVTGAGNVTGGTGGAVGVGQTSGAGGAGLRLSDGSLVNEGSVTGGLSGGANQGGSNSGTLTGAGGDGVVLDGGNLDNRGTITGGNSGDVTSTSNDNGYSGPGGVGARLTGGSHVNSGSITGGKAGIGANTPSGTPGPGPGGKGLVLTDGELDNSGTIAGSPGTTRSPGVGGAGGVGAEVTRGTLVNSGTVLGGDTGGNLNGGYGIAGVNATIVNSGSITGGIDPAGRAAAIFFSSGTNRLELHAGSNITGSVIANGTDTLALGGTANSTFDVTQIGGTYTGFEAFDKSGASTWTLTNTTTEVTPWTLTGGTLSVAADASLGNVAGTLTFDGGILQVTGTAFTGTTRTIDWSAGGGGFDIADSNNTFTVSQVLAGGGPLNKLGAGTLVLDADNTYAGGTTIGAGTLQLGAGGTSGSVTGDIANAGELVIDRSDTLAIDGVISGAGSLTQAGSGTTILIGKNTYTGATTVSAGTLQVGDGGTFGGLGDTSQVSVNAGANLAVNRADAFTLDQTVTGGGTLRQAGAGTTTMTVDSDISHVLLEAGRLVTPGSLLTDDVTFTAGGGATLEVTGTFETAGGTETLVNGGALGDTVIFGENAVARANGNLADGADTLDVPGTLDTGGGAFALGTGDDVFVVYDGTVVVGTVDGGAGLDTRVYDLEGMADLGALVNFEGVTKRGGGTLNINGPGASSLAEVRVEGGTLHIGAAVTDVVTTVVAADATLHVAGTHTATAGADTMTVAGTVTGGGAVLLNDGDDRLVLQDGANVSGLAVGPDGGVGTDTVQLDVAGALAFAGADTINFERMEKTGGGTATLEGAHAYTGVDINAGALEVNDALETPAVNLADGAELAVDGTLQAAGGAQTALSGSTGANTVTVNAAGSLFATGGLGDGADTLDVAGTLDAIGGTFALGAGDDAFVVYDGTIINGTVDGGAGLDTRVYDIEMAADLGALANFESLTKRGGGTLNINGPGSSNLAEVTVEGGTLHVGAAGGVTDVVTTVVGAGGTLDLDGSYAGSPGADTVTVAGTVTGAGGIRLGGGADRMDFAASSDLSGFTGPLDGGDDIDTLSFDNREVAIGSASALALSNWEILRLLGSTTLTQQGALGLGPGGELHVGADATWLPGGNDVAGSVMNAGRIELGMDRIEIGGDYASVNDTGTLAVTVSPADGTAGGLVIGGDVTGTSTVAFASDGSAPKENERILVVETPRDDAGTAGGFKAADTMSNGTTRIQGSPLGWSFERKDDGNWYLALARGVGGVLPEVAAYSHLDMLAKLAAGGLQGAAFDRNSEMRSCLRADHDNVDRDCGRAWAQAPVSRIEIDPGGGFRLEGDTTGGFFGADTSWHRAGGAATFGAFMQFQQGDFDVLPNALGGMASRLDFSTRQFGLYGSLQWDSGAYLDYNAAFGKQQSTVNTADGFSQVLNGYSASLGGRLGYGLLGERWTFDPYLGVTASKTDWQEVRDFGGRSVAVSGDIWTAGEAGLRMATHWPSGSKARFSLWLDVGATQSLSGGESGVDFEGDSGASAAGGELGGWARAELGAGLEFGRNVALHVAVAGKESLNEADYSEEQAYLGLRIDW